MKSLALAFSSVLFILVILELGLRFAGVEPWESSALVADMPRMSDRDAELGWISRPGNYRYRHMDREILTTIRADGARGTIDASGTEGEIWFFGCSFTQGWGLSDGQEFPARVARRIPGWIVRNFAVPGYSTLQAALLYERLLETAQRKPRLVVYGYAGFHEYRNTAAPHWLVNLSRIAGENEWIELPYARWDTEPGLRTFPPKSHAKWPLSEYSALLRQLNYRLTTLGDVAPPEEQRAVTLALLERWKQRVEREGVNS